MKVTFEKSDIDAILEVFGSLPKSEVRGILKFIANAVISDYMLKRGIKFLISSEETTIQKVIDEYPCEGEMLVYANA